MNSEMMHEKLVLKLNAKLYPEEVLFKCFYWYGDQFVTDISKQNDEFIVAVKKINGMLSSEELERLEKRVKCDLIDFRTRHIVAGETKAIRELITAKAFSSIDEYDQDPPGDSQDYFSYDPEKD